VDQLVVSDGRKRLARDAAVVRAEFEQLTATLGGRLDRARLLVVLAAAGRADRHLPRTVPRLLDQAATAGLGADFLIGCNAGFEPSRLVATLSAMAGVELINARCTKASLEPAPLFAEDGSPLVLDPARRDIHRVVVVRQADTPEARGKIRMLSDLFGWLDARIRSGWTPPAYLLNCDAESEFTGLAPFLNKGGEEKGLSRLVARLDADGSLEVIGARNRNTTFRTGEGGVLEPDLEHPVPAIQLGFNLLHTRAKGFDGLCGSGILGRTAAMVAAYTALCRLYPNTRIDDVQVTLLLQAAGLTFAVEPNVAAINYSPRVDQVDESNGQSGRWIGGLKDMEAAYGRDVVRPIATTALRSIIWHSIWLCHHDAWSNRGIAVKGTVVREAIRLLFGLRHYRRTYRRAIVQRGDDPGAIGYWPTG
jgi:hypothetical protein